MNKLIDVLLKMNSTLRRIACLLEDLKDKEEL